MYARCPQQWIRRLGLLTTVALLSTFILLLIRVSALAACPTDVPASREASQSLPYLYVEIARSPGGEESVAPISKSVIGNRFSLSGTAEPLFDIIYVLLETSSMRIQWDPSPAKELYDVEIVYETARPTSKAPKDVLKMLCSVTGVVIEESVQEADVWVARRIKGATQPRRGDHHPPTEGLFYARLANGRSAVLNASSRELFRFLESHCQAWIDDETGLEGNYDFSIGVYGGDLQTIREALEKDCGIVLSKESREVKIFHVLATRHEP